ncbi:hypothetical protein CTP45_07790 [Salmonella enterica]|uniref:Uncharacterized protein n=1 Tax=Salmonella enterica subsp. enterica serovar Saintpaul TaxID=90105 RepID=A0A5U9I4Y5_SALET|nr:hypothetical protein [Salmonella enterica]EBS2301356.1 hypothetical protein [Salmonella enterica subsp. enterica serovar Saintpaul]EDW0017490.1 hypothetical protein [Salmonella enterica subsp. enterica serovar Aba]HCZ4727718.1 hypothetical protein [Salmonella enterica subsp. enterica serovar Saintpaul str. CFSAN004137]EAW8023112.1 hypothetical protein [Salmonella enterica]
MSGAIKKILGGGSSKETTKQSSNSTSSSFLINDKPVRTAITNAENQIGNIAVTPFQVANRPQSEQEALARLGRGEDYSTYKNASDLMQKEGQSLYQTGSDRLNSSAATLERLQNLTPDDIQNMIKANVNTGLLNDQIAGLKTDVNDAVMQNLHGIDQSATASGNMGSSRAGIQSGVAIGQGAKAVSSGTIQLRTAAENTARQDLLTYLQNQSSTAQGIANIGSQETSTGLNMFGQGIDYFGRYTQGQLQNNQNAVNSGEMQRQYDQLVIEAQRQNAGMQSAPDLYRLGIAGQTLLPFANLSQNTNGTTTQTTNTPSGGGLLQMATTGAGMWAGNQGYLSFMGGTGAQQQQAGGMFGSMAGTALSRLF